MLKTIDVKKEYEIKLNGKKRKIQALKGISLEIEDNQSVALVGESGSGKSTLGRILSFIEKPDEGKLFLDDINLSDVKHKELVKYRGKVQLVMQDALSSLDPRQTISQILDEPLKLLLKMPSIQREVRKKELLDMVKLSKDVLKKNVHELSGGQQKRVCIIRALAAEPRYIIFDESFSGLDVIVRKQILDLLIVLKKSLDVSYIVITHDLDEAMFIANTIYVMKDGILEDKLEDPKTLEDFKSTYARKLAEAVLLKRQTLNKYKGGY